jgi:hypothetical protein
MADTGAFDFVCAQLEAGTSLDRLEARGTVRLALKQAGFEARGVSPEQMAVVVARILPEELASRGVEDSAGLCASIGAGLQNLEAGEVGDTPDAVFQRLGGTSAAG